MKLKSDFTIREIAGDYIIVPTGDNYLDFGAVVSLNESGAFLWKQLAENKTVEELISALTNEYSVDINTASEDISEFIKLLKEHGLICDE